MKKLRTFFVIVSSAFLLCADSVAESLTNEVFNTQPYDIFHSPYFDSENATSQFLDILHKGVTSKYGRELLPAEQDREGNWGLVTNGIRLSIRFYQTNFTNGEPVPTVLLWRNVSDEAKHIGFGWGTENYPFDFVLHREGKLENPLLPRWVPRDFGGGPSPQPVDSRNQIRFILRLDKIFDLKPGAYEVSAKRDNAESGTAKFWVFPKAETQTNNPAGLK